MIKQLAGAFAVCALMLGTSMTAHATSPRTLSTFSVMASQPWTDTNVIIDAGMRVTISATSVIHVNIGGAIQAPGGDGGAPGCIGDASFVASGLPCWSLIGRIDNGAPFEVGAHRTFTARTFGHLLLGVNDQSNGFSDNSGAWTVVIKVNPSLAFAVSAMQPWTDTGIVPHAGSHVSIAAIGSIHVNNGGAIQPPTGDGGSPGCIGDASFVAPGLSCWSLIGRIGNGAPFEIGRFRAFTVPFSGHLFLGVNDQSGGFNDNSGSWSAVVVVSRPSPSSDKGATV